MSLLLPTDFYFRPTEEVARDLLGRVLVHLAPDGRRVAGRIVETEAYLGIEDRACHTFGDRRTPRTSSMYLPGGHAYVYFIYGMHFCFNVVTRAPEAPEAVLVRALEPLEGIDLMRERRGLANATGARAADLARGPAKLCDALAIDRSCDGLRLDRAPLFIEEGRPFAASEIEASPRIGVAYAGEAAQWPMRFSVRGHPDVSRAPKRVARDT